MRLQDFALDQGFLQLRETMGATDTIQIGDPTWEDWDGFGINIGDLSDVDVNRDDTLSHKGRRVLVYIRDQTVRHDETTEVAPTDQGFRYHIAECPTLTRFRKEKRYARYVVTTRTDQKFVVHLYRWGENIPYQKNSAQYMDVCKNCLTKLNYKGYGALVKKEKRGPWKNFDPEVFLDEYGSLVKGLPTYTSETAPANEYPPDWRAISLEIRRLRKWKCEDADCKLVFAEPETRKWLHVHHVDGNRANCAQGNLSCLCLEHHTKQPQHAHLRNSPGYDEFLRWASPFR